MTDRSPDVDGADGGPDCACDSEDSGVAQIGPAIGAHFDAKINRAGPTAGSGLHVTTQAILRLLGDPTGCAILELGCGRGGLMVGLLRAGASRASGVELSAASVASARDRFVAAGLADRVTLAIGDGAKAPLDPHDWVILDRVICCYPDADGLLANSIPAARSRYAFAVPDSHGWRGLAARITRRLDNAWNGLRGRPCATFVHDMDRMDRTLRSAGFRKRGSESPGLWYVAVYERA